MTHRALGAKRRPALALATALAFGGADALAAGPGLGNVDYAPSEVFTVVGTIDESIGAPRGHGSLAMLDGYLLVVFSRDSGEGDGGFALFDVSDPRNPQNVLTKDDDETEDIREAHGFGMSRIDGRLYLALQALLGIQIWDFTDPLAPVLVSYPKLPGVAKSDYGTGAWWLSWQGNRIYVGGSSNGLYIVDASDPAKPVLVDRGSEPNPIPTGYLGSFKTGPVFALGNLLAIMGMDQPGYTTLDISNPDHPTLLATRNDTSSIYSGILNGNWLLGAGSIAKSVAVYDISDPLKIELVGEVKDLGDRGGYVTFQDGFAHLGVSSNYAKVDLRTPGAFQVAGTGSSNHPGRDEDFSTVLGNLAFISDDHGNGSWLMPHQAARDLEPPSVNRILPAHGATGRAPTSRVGISFTDQIDFGTVGPSTISVRPAGSAQALDGIYSYFANLVNFTPKQPLATDTTYEVVVAKGGVKDVAGNAIAEGVVALFSTGGVVENPDCKLTPKQPLVVGESVNYTLQTGLSGNLTTEWDFGDGSPRSTTSDHAFAEPGHYTVIAYVYDSGELRTSCTLPQTVHRPLAPGSPTRSSTVAFDAPSGRVYVVNPDHDSLTAIDVAGSARVWEMPAGNRPRSVVVGPDGNPWVASDLSGTATLHDASSGDVLATIEFHPAARPSGLALSPDGARAYVTLLGTGELAEIDVAKRAVARSVEVGPSPRAIAVTADGSRLFVSRFVSPLDHGEVTVLDGDSLERVRVEELAHDESPDSESGGRGVLNYLRSLAVSPDATRVFLAAKKDNVRRGGYNDGEKLTFESTLRSVTAQLLVEGGEDLGARVDLDDRGLPSAVVPSPLGDLVFVATELTSSVEVVDAYSGRSVTSIQGLGRAPDGLALDADGKRLFVHSFLSRTLEVVDVAGVLDNASGAFEKLASVPTVAGEVLAPDVLLGKRIFYDSEDDRMSRDNYLACASCHLDGEHDGRTWDFSDRGEGLRNTITLLGKRGLGQGPLHWSANFDEVQDFEHDMRGPFGGLGFMSDADFAAGRDEPLAEPKAGVSDELDALAAYVSSLDSVNPSPYRKANGAFTDEALAGKAIFERLDCAECHSGDRFTNSADGELYDVGTITAASGYRLWEILPGLDTPTLVGLWETAPYLHDGSAATVRDVLDRAAQSGNHGDVAGLSSAERDQLARYLLELDDRPVVGEPAEEDSGCGCRSAGGKSERAWPLLVAGLGWFAFGLRRSRRLR